MDVRFKKEEQKALTLKSGLPITKLEKILGKNLLKKIKDEYPELY